MEAVQTIRVLDFECFIQAKPIELPGTPFSFLLALAPVLQFPFSVKSEEIFPPPRFDPPASPDWLLNTTA